MAKAPRTRGAFFTQVVTRRPANYIESSPTSGEWISSSRGIAQDWAQASWEDREKWISRMIPERINPQANGVIRWYHFRGFLSDPFILQSNTLYFPPFFIFADLYCVEISEKSRFFLGKEIFIVYVWIFWRRKIWILL